MSVLRIVRLPRREGDTAMRPFAKLLWTVLFLVLFINAMLLFWCRAVNSAVIFKRQVTRLSLLIVCRATLCSSANVILSFIYNTRPTGHLQCYTLKSTVQQNAMTRIGRMQ